MYAAIKNLMSSVTGNSVTETVKTKKPGVKAAVSSLQKERIKLIDQMCASLGNDYSARQRYFQLS